MKSSPAIPRDALIAVLAPGEIRGAAAARRQPANPIQCKTLTELGSAYRFVAAARGGL